MYGPGGDWLGQRQCMQQQIWMCVSVIVRVEAGDEGRAPRYCRICRFSVTRVLVIAVARIDHGRWGCRRALMCAYAHIRALEKRGASFSGRALIARLFYEGAGVLERLDVAMREWEGGTMCLSNSVGTYTGLRPWRHIDRQINTLNNEEPPDILRACGGS